MVCEPTERARLMVPDMSERSRTCGARRPSANRLVVPGPRKDLFPVDFVAFVTEVFVPQCTIVRAIQLTEPVPSEHDLARLNSLGGKQNNPKDLDNTLDMLR